MDRIVTVQHCGFQPSGGHRPLEMRRSRAPSLSSLMRQFACIGGQDGKGAHQADSLGREHRRATHARGWHPKRHAPEMFEIDWTVIGSERRRWHSIQSVADDTPWDNPNLPPHRSGSGIFESQSYQWLTQRFA